MLYKRIWLECYQGKTECAEATALGVLFPSPWCAESIIPPPPLDYCETGWDGVYVWVKWMVTNWSIFKLYVKDGQIRVH